MTSIGTRLVKNRDLPTKDKIIINSHFLQLKLNISYFIVPVFNSQTVYSLTVPVQSLAKGGGRR